MDNSRYRQRKYRKVMVVLGLSLMSLPQGFMLYWGNIKVYIDSYYLFVVQSHARSNWIISSFFISRIIALLVVSRLENIFGKHLAPVLTVCFGSLGIFFSFFSVQESSIWLVFTLGAVYGFGSGATYGWVLEATVKHTNNDLGFLNSLTFASSCGGAMITNELATRFINPSNHQPLFDLDDSKYFAQKDLLDRIPGFFIILGIFTLATQVLGFCLVQIAHCLPSKCFDYHNEVVLSGPEDRVHSEYGSNIKRTKNSLKNKDDVEETQQLDNANVDRATNGILTSPSKIDETIQLQTDPTPKEILKTPIFYELWFALFFGEMPFLMILNFYKSFGQLRIHNDHFLADTGTARAFTIIWGRLLWGVVMDKKGVKTTLTYVNFLLIITLFWYYFTPIADKWLYFAITLLLGALSTGFHTTHIGIAAFAFGEKSVSTNLGLLRTSSIALNLAAPIAFDVLMMTVGWFYFFTIIGALSVISLVLFALFLPDI